MESSTSGPSSPIRTLLAGAVAGKLAGLAYLVTAGLDNRISGKRLYDLLLLGRPFARSTRSANMLGTVIHFSNSAALGAFYALVGERRMPGPPVVKGIVFTTVEGTLLYPLMLLERFHPARKSDEMGSYLSVSAYLWTLPRHVVYGAVLGWLYPKLRNR